MPAMHRKFGLLLVEGALKLKLDDFFYNYKVPDLQVLYIHVYIAITDIENGHVTPTITNP